MIVPPFLSQFLDALLQDASAEVLLKVVAVALVMIFSKVLEKKFQALKDIAKQKNARRSQKRAEKRVSSLFIKYQRVKVFGSSEKRDVQLSLENMKVIFYLGLSAVVAESVQYAGFVIALPILYVAWSRYTRYVDMRENFLAFDSFDKKIKDQILELRSICDMDDEIRLWWNEIFGELAPF